MNDTYIKSHETWAGNITTFSELGSFPEQHYARVVEVGHMESLSPTFVVEVQIRDALNKPQWISSLDPNVTRAAFTKYIIKLRGE